MKREKATIRNMRNLRFYFVFGSMALLLQLIFVGWSYRIIVELDSVQEQPHSIISDIHKIHNNLHRDRPPDGSFNGYPVFYHDLTLDKTYHSRPYSSVRCVGENYQGDDFAWMHRSCHFRFLCFNVSSREFEVYARPDDETLGLMMSQRPFMDLSASVVPPPRVQTNGHDGTDSRMLKTGAGVSLGSGTVRHSRYYFDDTDNDIDPRLRHLKESQNWFPTVVRSSPPEQYYALEEGVVFVPFHSVSEESPENQEKQYSAVWDDLFPIYTLLNIFQLKSPDKEPLLMRFIPSLMSNSGHGEDEMKGRLNDNKNYLLRTMDRFRPLMMKRGNSNHDQSWSSQIDAMLRVSEEEKMLPLESGLVCAKDGVAGLGPYGIRYMKGRNNRHVFHNQGKGGILWMFRNYCLGNLGLSEKSKDRTVSSLIRLVFSTTSANDLASIETEMRDFLLSKDPESLAEIESHDFSNDNNMDMISRVKLMTETTVFIATCNDATATAALFLPRGASLIVLYGTDNHDAAKEEAQELTSACLGYKDLLNNLSHVFIHWLPLNAVHTKEGREVLFGVVKHATGLR